MSLGAEGPDFETAIVPRSASSTLVLFRGGWGEFMASLQQRMRSEMRRSSCLKAGLSNARSDWQSQPYVDDEVGSLTKQISMLARVGSHRTSVPAVAGCRLMHWSLRDSLKAAGKILGIRGELKVGQIVQHALDQDWTRRHSQIVSDDVEQITNLAKGSSACAAAGVCLCDRRGKGLRYMWSRLQPVTSVAFPPSSAARSLLTSCWIGYLFVGERVEDMGHRRPDDGGGVGLESSSDDEDPELHFVHVAVHSLSPWRPTFLRVQDLVLEAEDQRLRCMAGTAWARVWGVLRALDLQKQWTLMTFHLRDCPEAIGDFIPGELEYELFGDGDFHRVPFWRGHQGLFIPCVSKW